MTNPCVEFYVYKVKDAAEAASARATVIEAIKSYDGFVSWRALEGIEEPSLFVDYVEWASHDKAKAAGEAFTRDPRTAAFMNAIDEMVTMSHCEQTFHASA